jgi:hypothetical protein
MDLPHAGDIRVARGRIVDNSVKFVSHQHDSLIVKLFDGLKDDVHAYIERIAILPTPARQHAPDGAERAFGRAEGAGVAMRHAQNAKQVRFEGNEKPGEHERLRLPPIFGQPSRPISGRF